MIARSARPQTSRSGLEAIFSSLFFLRVNLVSLLQQIPAAQVVLQGYVALAS
jgi:hypothetical protein